MKISMAKRIDIIVQNAAAPTCAAWPTSSRC